jgi:branched-chain amino acid transport system ATP-binding protein
VSTLLEVDGVKVHFGGVRAVDGVNIEIEQGRLYGLVGPNGSGKSVLLASISRLAHLTEGRLLFQGTEYQSLSPAKTARMGIGRTFQAVRLLPNMTVLENVMLGGDSRFFGAGIMINWLMPWHTRSAERQCREAAFESMERLELGEFTKHRAGDLPYGIQRKVEIARALTAKPQLVLYDEPTAGMNREERDDIGRVMTELSKGGLTQILVEHDMPMITEICDYMYCMSYGKLIAEGQPSAVVSNPQVQEAYLGKRGGARDAA